MPLDDSALKDAMKSEIEALSDFPTGGIDPIIVDDRVLGAIAKAVVDHIVANGLVTGTATVAGGSSSGVHPVTGTIT